MLKKSRKWVGYDFTDGHWDKPLREGTDESDEMRQFFKDFKSDLAAALKKAGLRIYQIEPNYYDVTAVISNPEKTRFVYISLGDMRYEPHWEARIMYRTMAHPKDWTGGANHWTDAEHLVDEVKWLMERSA